ncbi:hypothetical protein THAOC_21989, partial [Thalassiosira oceanica]
DDGVNAKRVNPGFEPGSARMRQAALTIVLADSSDGRVGEKFVTSNAAEESSNP